MAGKYAFCKRFLVADCGYGDACRYAHDVQELRPEVRLSYKTTLCRKFVHGWCPVGPACMYAHGPRDMFYHRASMVRVCGDPSAQGEPGFSFKGSWPMIAPAEISSDEGLHAITDVAKGSLFESSTA